MHITRALAVTTIILLALFCSTKPALAERGLADKAVFVALKKPVTIRGDNLPLKEVVDTITKQVRLEARVNWPALELVGIDQDSIVSLQLKAVSAGHALQIALDYVSAEAFDDDKAGFAVVKGKLNISTQRDLKSETETRNYSIRKYINAARGKVPAQEMADMLAEIISICVGDPDEWLDEESTINEDRGIFAIKTTAGNHDAIEALFDQIDNPIDNARAIQQPDHRAVKAKLDKVLSYENNNGSLDEAIGYIRESTGLNIAVNWASLELVGIDQDALVTITLKRVPANQLLALVLDQVSADAFDDDKAGFVIRENVVHISTLRDFKGDTQTQVYKLSKWMGRKAGDQEAVWEVIEAIQTRVGDPDEWLDEESTITELYGLLIVNTTAENHLALIKLLETIGR